MISRVRWSETCWSPSSSLSSPLFVSHSGQNTIFLKTLSLCFSLHVGNRVSHPYRTTGKIIILCILIFTLLDSKRDEMVEGSTAAAESAILWLAVPRVVYLSGHHVLLTMCTAILSSCLAPSLKCIFCVYVRIFVDAFWLSWNNAQRIDGLQHEAPCII